MTKPAQPKASSFEPKEWLKLVWIVPVLYVFGTTWGFVSGAIDVSSHQYLSQDLTNIAIQNLTQQINFYSIFSLRLMVPVLIFCAGYLLGYGNFSKALTATFGSLLLWVVMLFSVFLLIRHAVADIDLHKLPDFVRRSLSLEGFFKKRFFDTIQLWKMARIPMDNPGMLVAMLTVAIPFGIFFERWVSFKIFSRIKEKHGAKFFVFFWIAFLFATVSFISLNGVAFAIQKRTNIRQPNIIFISLDTLRADSIGPYGSVTAKTPTLDKLASEGAVFENAYANSPWTLPSHASLLTALTPTHLGIRKVQDRLGPGAMTMPEILKNYGYSTAAITSYILVSPAYGFDQGFDHFNYDKDYTAEKIVDRAIEYIERRQLKKHFLFLHFYDPHWPYKPKLDIAKKFYSKPPTEELIKLHNETDYFRWVRACLNGPQEWTDFSKAMYDAEISYVDGELKRLFEKIDQLAMSRRTLVVVTSDHGEEFKEHGLMGHGLTLYDESLRVPLLVRFPKMIPGNTRIKMRVQLMDLMPTILSMVGIEHPLPKQAGREMTTEFFTGAGSKARTFLAETAMSGDVRFAVMEDTYKYITPFTLSFGDLSLHHDAEIYDLSNDPAEQTNLIPEKPTLEDHFKKTLSEKLLSIQQGTAADGSQQFGKSKALSSEEIERLRSLGYIQ